MYLLSQLALFLLLAFLLGVSIGYALWRTWGQREIIAKFNAAEMRLAAHLQRLEKTARDTAAYNDPISPRAGAEQRWEEAAKRERYEFEATQAAMLKEAQDAAVRNAEAAAEKKFADLAKVFGYGEKPVGQDLASRIADNQSRSEPRPVPHAEPFDAGVVTQLRTKTE